VLTAAIRRGCGAGRIVGSSPHFLKHPLHLGPVGADDLEVNLTQCPYDGAQVEVEISSGGSLLLTCVACAAVWERHGAWTGRIREPDREKLLAARAHGSTITPAEPLPMTPVMASAMMETLGGRDARVS
jgi:hypothetical protein